MGYRLLFGEPPRSSVSITDSARREGGRTLWMEPESNEPNLAPPPLRASSFVTAAPLMEQQLSFAAPAAAPASAGRVKGAVRSTTSSKARKKSLSWSRSDSDGSNR